MRPARLMRTKVCCAIAMATPAIGASAMAQEAANARPGLTGAYIVECLSTPVRNARGGLLARIQVVEGQSVEAGDVLMIFDQKPIDAQIAALNAQLEAATRKLDVVRRDITAMTHSAASKEAARSRVADLQSQVGDVEAKVAALNARIALAEQDLEASAVRAPVAGRVIDVLTMPAGQTLKPGQTVLNIVFARERLVVEGPRPQNQIEPVTSELPAFAGLAFAVQIDQRLVGAGSEVVGP